MSLPCETKVGCVTYETRIRKMREVEAGRLCGEIDYSGLEIQVSEDLAPGRQLHTYIHELVHAICNESGLITQREDEDFVDRFANTLAQVIVDNKWKMNS